MLTIKSLGICFGASSLKVFELIKENNNIKYGKSSIIKVQSSYLNTVSDLFNNLNQYEYKYCIITGRNLKYKIPLASINELEAVESALEFLKIQNRLNFNINAIISLGAENFILYHLNESGNICKVEAENKCASGTGDFFLQQINRLNLSIDEAVDIGKNYKPYEISGRCSVYCKSDCTHALNKGIPIGNVVAGLHNMMANKILYLLEKVESKNIMLIGGVTKNSTLIDILKQEVDNLYIPDEAIFFEALGAAYYAIKNKAKLISKNIDFKNSISHQYHFLPPIQQKKELVKFYFNKFEKANENDDCIIGLDAGSTTTKSVIIRIKDNTILSSTYLRTNGDPIKASRECYSLLDKQINKKINIIGIGVTGSGRSIVGLHAGTEGIINEIIAHASGAVYFDKEVETIFEIGGQDAKYIYLSNGIPIDYAMNESCAAGTGSFLEEAIKNNFSIDCFDLANYAFRSKKPPNFSDQCSAFINSDIKNAIQENIPQDDIIAGIIYSICFNYLNKVKAQRQIGKKIFMQGGVCYNKAVPYAMANLLNKKIIVPPEPGLIGAFGVALEIKNRIQNGLLLKKEFNLKELADTEIAYGKTFKCKQDNYCDRKCNINIMIIKGKKYPFGGACNRYYNKIHNIKGNSQKYNFTKIRENLIFNQHV